MRWKKRHLINLIVFGGALCYVLSLNLNFGPSNKNKTFAWTTIRYKTTSSKLPGAHGICTGMAGTSKPALVVARVKADGSANWLNNITDRYHICLYNADMKPNPLSNNPQIPANRGHEAMVYLTFIIDNYDNIPSAGVVFVHGARWSWHNDHPEYDNAALLVDLNVSAALKSTGYHNMRCDWSAGTCDPSKTPPQGSLETSLNALLQPWDERSQSDAAISRALASLFGGDGSARWLEDSVVDHEYASPLDGGGRLRLDTGDVIRSQCCAQFVVARDNIWYHTRDEYVAIRQWLLDGNSSAPTEKSRHAAPSDDRIAGRILSYLWHILFMQPGISHGTVNLDMLNELSCPRADDCYCRLYGRCDLEGCTRPGLCYGQYALPKDYKLPDDWALKHS